MKLQCPRIHKSACGCSLQTGSKIIGYVCTLVGIGLLVSGISLALDEHEHDANDPDMRKLSLIIGATSAGYGLVFFVASFLLLCGAIQAKRRCMLPFLVFEYVNIILIIVLIPWLIYEGLFVLSIFLLVPLCLIVYMIIILQSFYIRQTELFTF